MSAVNGPIPSIDSWMLCFMWYLRKMPSEVLAFYLSFSCTSNVYSLLLNTVQGGTVKLIICLSWQKGPVKFTQ